MTDGLARARFAPVFACMLVGLTETAATPAYAQVPRIAPPPPCKVAGITEPLLLLRPPATPGRPLVVVFPFTQGVIERRHGHVPYSIAAGIRERLRASPRIVVPSAGITARATFESGGGVDSAMKLLGAAYAVRGEVEPEGSQTRLRVHVESANGKVLTRGTYYLPRHIPGSIEEVVAAGVLAAVAPGSPVPLGRDHLASAALDLQLIGARQLMTGHSLTDLDEARQILEGVFKADTSVVVARTLGRAIARAAMIRGLQGVDVANDVRRLEALASYVMARDSTDATPWTLRAIVARLSDPVGFRGALEAHERAVAKPNRRSEDEREYATTLWYLGRSADARAHLLKALALEPGEAQSLALMAEVEDRLGQPARVCAFTNASIAADPFNARPYVLRAHARLRLGQARESYADAELAYQMDPSLASRALRLSVEAGATNVEAANRLARDLVRDALGTQRMLGVNDAVALSRGLTASGMQREAITALLRARPRGSVLRSSLADRAFDALRGDTSFRAIVTMQAEQPAR